MEFIGQIEQVKKPLVRLVDSLEEQYSAAAFKFGYFEAQSPCWLYFMKKDGAAAAFEVQFGNVSEFKSSLGRLVKSGAQLCFLITSSRAHAMRLEEVCGLLLRNFAIGKQKFVFIDIENGRSIKVNFEWEDFSKGIASDGQAGPQGRGGNGGRPLFRESRRKKIYGRRGEHKLQD